MDLHHQFKSLFLTYKVGENSEEVRKFLESNNLFGRIVRAHDDDFSLMSESWKKLSWVMDGTGLCELLGMTGNDMLLHAGSQQQWINTKVKQGFKLAVFTLKEEQCKLATWDNILLLLQSYPELKLLMANNQLHNYLNDLKTLPFEEINKQWTHDIMEVYYKGREDPRFLTTDRFSLLSSPSLSDFRAFLLQEVGLGVLYDGKGYTKKESGEQGLREYLTPNVQLSTLPHVLIDLTVVEK